jgi:hypothetical protein
MDCGLNTVSIHFAAQSPSASIQINGETFGSAVTKDFSLTNPGQQEINVVVKTGAATYTCHIILIRPAENLVVQIWSNVLSIINEPANNGGYSFRSYQWQENGVDMPGATKEYLYLAGNPNANTSDYSVILTTTDGKQVQSCSMTLAGQAVSKISAYPNPTQGAISIESDLINPGDEINIYNSTGSFVMKYTAEKHKTTIDLSTLPEGIYMVRINNEQVKVIKTNK